MEIKVYSEVDEDNLFDMMKKEGAEWEDYWGDSNRDKYKTALSNSITFLSYDEDELCGYVRCRDDDGFGIYIYDLLVKKSKRGNNIGRALMESVCSVFPNNRVYVMSDVDDYYKKHGYRREGSIFEVK